jgi:single-stranded-DNA-specific exonuclease
VVVDHHLVPATPLPADAFLNPHRPECGFPYKGLCSAGLALSLAAAVRAELGARLDLRRWLDLVALGTIADVAPLDGDNRRLVRFGLGLLSGERARPGVQALREAAKMRAGAPVGGGDIGFRLAPRLNAAGRLGDPEVTVRLLRARSLPEARALAARIEQLNQERRQLQERMSLEAQEQALDLYGDRVDGGIVVASASWHRGVVGIVAARLAERFGAPAVVIALEEGIGHGSGRTPDGFDLHAAISSASGCLLKFGGHAAAAGLSLEATQLERLRADFDDACRRARAAAPPLDARPLVDVVIGDGFELPTAGELQLLEPLGEGNAEPTFLLPDARIDEARVVGSGHLKLALTVGGRRLSAFGWELGGLADSLGAEATLWGNLRPDSWRGGEAIELRVGGVL